jgi:hypothetical protein
MSRPQFQQPSSSGSETHSGQKELEEVQGLADEGEEWVNEERVIFETLIYSRGGEKGSSSITCQQAAAAVMMGPVRGACPIRFRQRSAQQAKEITYPRRFLSTPTAHSFSTPSPIPTRSQDNAASPHPSLFTRAKHQPNADSSAVPTGQAVASFTPRLSGASFTRISPLAHINRQKDHLLACLPIESHLGNWWMVMKAGLPWFARVAL